MKLVRDGVRLSIDRPPPAKPEARGGRTTAEQDG
jgi:hypothetical protein